MAPYDSVVNYYVSDPQKVRNMLNDPDWNDKVVAFEEGWNNQKEELTFRLAPRQPTLRTAIL